MRIYILWESYKGVKWIRDIYLSRTSAERFKNNWPDKELRIEEFYVHG